MPRRSAGPRLYLDPRRAQWVIRDGTTFCRTGCGVGSRGDAEKQLAEYIGRKHKPAPSNDPLLDDVLAVYGREHAPSLARNGSGIGYIIGRLLPYWSGKRVSDVTARTCRAYPGQRQHLEYLRAAIRYWHREYGPLTNLPTVILPPKGAPRDRWLTRSEAARLVWASRRHENIKRFILLGLHTGSRAGVLLALEWSWIDLAKGVMHRRAPGEPEGKTKRRPPVKLGRQILHFLRRWHAVDGGAGRIVHYQGRPMWRIYVGWGVVVAKAGLGDDVTPHVLRHTRATWLVQRGVSLWETAGHLGMSVKVLESVYGHHAPDFQGNAANV